MESENEDEEEDDGHRGHRNEGARRGEEERRSREEPLRARPPLGHENLPQKPDVHNSAGSVHQVSSEYRCAYQYQTTAARQWI